MPGGQVIVHGALRRQRLAAQRTIVGEHAGKMDALHMIPHGHAARKALAAECALEVAQEGRAHILEEIVGRGDGGAAF